MKKRSLRAAVLAALALLLALSGCQKRDAVEARPREAQVSPAIDALKERWGQLYDRPLDAEDDRYLEIKNTRVIHLKEGAGEVAELFRDVDYAVDFILYSNYFSSAPYYMNAGSYDCVLLYKDGSAKVSSNVFQLYGSRYYSYDFSDVIDTVEDLGDAYNQLLKL